MEVQFELVRRYPWLSSLKDVYSDIGLKSPSDFISEIFSHESYPEIEERVLKIFRAAFENLEGLSEYTHDELNIYLYLILKILLYVFDNTIITNRIANLYSKINNDELNKENDYNIYYICEDLKLDIRYNREPWEYGINIIKDQKETLKTNFKIHFVDYLKLASKLRDDYRKLTSNPLSKGYVFVQKRRLIRLIQEYVREKILEVNSEDKSTIETRKKELFKIDKFKELYHVILNIWNKQKDRFEYSNEFKYKKGEDLSEIYPPCMKEILSKAQEGQNLPHTERLVILFFLHAMKYPLEDIIKVFSNMPDFDRNKKEYQVKFAIKKDYIPHSCATLKSLNLCMAKKHKDELCLEGYYSKKDDIQKKINHPLSYVRIKRYRVSQKHKLGEKEIDKEK